MSPVDKSLPLVLLPPSQGKAPGGSPVVSRGVFNKTLSAARRMVLQALAESLRAGPASKVLGAKGPLLERYIEATAMIAAPGALLMPAWQRYSGVVWTGLAPGSLSKEQRGRIIVPSGLYGVIAGNDLIADYRLTMKTSLKGLGPVGSFWLPYVTRALDPVAADREVVNLLPAEHRAVLTAQALDRAHVTDVTFVTPDNKAAAGHAAKYVKGVIAATVLSEGIAALSSFSWEGWTVKQRGACHYEVAAPKVPPRHK
jgi:uncharacterized protein